MNNMLKTIFVVSVMGGALYGAYVLLNENEFRSRQTLAQTEELLEPRIDFGGPAAPGEVMEPGPYSPSSESAAEPGPYIPAESGPWSPPGGSTSPEQIASLPAATPGAYFEPPGASTVAPVPASSTAGEYAPAETNPGALQAGEFSPGPESFGAADVGATSAYDPGPGEFNGASSAPRVPAQYASADVSGSGYQEPGDLGEPDDLGQEEFQPNGDPAGGYTPADEESFQPSGPSPEGLATPAEEPFQSNALPPAIGPSDFADASSGSAGALAGDAVASGASAGVAASEAARASFAQSVERAKAQVAEQNYRDALATLSIAYGNPDLPEAETAELHDLLDALAGKVIYSSEHLHRQPYVIRQGETLESIVQTLRVTPEFLVRINGLDPVTRQLPPPGSTIKTVQGPFRAEIRLRSNVSGTLTLFLGELYAGRFDVALGQDNPPFPGKYTVRDKQTDRPFYTAQGTQIPANSPDNPYGGVWIDLGSGIALHGSPATPSPGGQLGCMAVPQGQAEDLFSILSIGSTVEVRQ